MPKFLRLLVLSNLFPVLLFAAQVSVLTQRNDNGRTSANLDETLLNTSNVNVNQFGKLFFRPVDGQIYAQPLYLSNLTIPGMGTHNVVFTCTEHNSVYAFDADDPTASAPLWSVNLGPSVPSTDLSCSDLTPEIGITSTPVIDPVSGTLYVCNKTRESGAYFHNLHALDITSGAEKFGGPVRVTATVPGTGAGSSGGTLTFNALWQLNRAGLLLLNGVVYIGYGSHCDNPPYHGWLFGYNASTLQLTSVLSTSPNDSSGGIWQSGNGPAADGNGNIWIMTGNGAQTARFGGSSYGSSVVKLTTTGGTLSVASWFTPHNTDNLSATDADVGAGGPMLLPATNLLVGNGKEGVVYLLNRDNLGGYDPVTDRVVQEFKATPTIYTGPCSCSAYWNGPNGPLIYYWTTTDVLKAFSFNGTSIQTVPQAKGSTVQVGRAGGISISANGSSAGSGILWGVNDSVLRAYDASNVSRELWNSQSNSARDALPTYTKFCPPTIANGKVYVASRSNGLFVYGLLNLPNSVSASITGPANNAAFTLPAPITITVNAAQSNPAIPISKVEIFANSSLIGAAAITSSSNWRMTWQPAQAGNYALTAKATDANGLYAVSSVVNISVANGYTTWQSYKITTQPGAPQAIVIDDAAKFTATFEFYESANAGGVDEVSPFGTFNAGIHPDAYNNVEKYWANSMGAAYPYAGKSTIGRGLAIGETNAPPPLGVRDLQLFPDNNTNLTVAAFIAPIDGAYSVSNLAARRVDTVGGTIRYKVFDSTKTLVANIQAFNKQAWVIDSSIHPLGTLKAGSRIYFAVDADGDNIHDATEIAWTITCNQLPNVAVVSPTNGATFTAPASITMNAIATDADDSIASVDFLANGTLLGTLSSPPYTLTSVNIPAGAYTLTARATDSAGAQAVSAPVNITVLVGNGSPYGLNARQPVAPYLNMPQAANGTIPALLSQTGVFSNLATLAPASGIMPYGVNVPLWSDSAAKLRWIALPNSAAPYTPGQQVSYNATGDWFFPNGTVFVKHFELGTDDTNPAVRRRLETRLLVRSADGGVYGVTYKWRADNSDADLLPGSLSENITIATAGGSRTQTWYYPGRSDCLACHTAISGGVLGVKTRQLNGGFGYSGMTDNQLRVWNHLGMLNPAINEADIPLLTKLSPGNDTTTSLETRARSYIDANCQHCHRPGGARANFDARFDTALPNQNIVSFPAIANLGIDGAQIVQPQDIWRSVMYQRMNSLDPAIKMPPLARNVNDSVALSIMRDWINSLPGTPALPPPGISPPGGRFSAPVSVTIADNDPGAVIRYTLDGSLPAPASTLYTGPISISGNTNLRAAAFRDGYATSASTSAVFVFSALPPPWQDQDIGAVGLAGSATASNGTFTVAASGVDIWQNSDGFHFVYQPMNGDGQIIARVNTVQNTDPWAKAGVMIRQNLTATSPHAYAALTSGNGIAFQRRLSDGGITSHTPGSFVAAPYWVKLTRSGSVFTAYQSADGINWIQVGSDSVNMTGTVYTGLALTAHNNSMLNTSALDNVSVQFALQDIPPTVSITAPVGGATYTAPASVSITATASDADGTIAKVDFYNGATLLGSSTAAPYTYNWNNVPAGAYSLTARATDNAGLSTTSAPITINVSSPGLPTPWIDADVGATGVAGSASVSNGAFSVNGSGSDIWLNSDSFNFLYQPLSGDGQIVARVVTLQNTDSWAKAGVMIRQSLAADSPHALMAQTFGNGIAFQRRLSAGGASLHTAGSLVSAPYWVKLIKNGSAVTGYQSADGINWVQVGSDTIAMSGTMYWGLAVTAHNNAALNAATFDSVSIQIAGAPDIPPTVVMTAPVNGSVFTAPANITLSANASDADGIITRVDFFNGAALLASSTSAPYTYNWSNVPAGSYSLTAKATDNAGLTTTSGIIGITVNAPSGALPSPWIHQDVGPVGIPGSAAFSAGTFSVSAAGVDIWDAADSFHFVYQPLNGDGQITARVGALQNTDPWAKAGVMIRQSLDPGSPHAFMALTAGNGTAFQRRPTQGSVSAHTGGTAVTVPFWVRLVRTGNTLTGYQSNDGVTWSFVGSDSITMPAAIYIGLAVTSHNASALNAASFDNVSLP